MAPTGVCERHKTFSRWILFLSACSIRRITGTCQQLHHARHGHQLLAVQHPHADYCFDMVTLRKTYRIHMSRGVWKAHLGSLEQLKVPVRIPNLDTFFTIFSQWTFPTSGLLSLAMTYGQKEKDRCQLPKLESSPHCSCLLIQFSENKLFSSPVCGSYNMSSFPLKMPT